MALPIARLSDQADCPCGCIGIIITGASTVFAENLPVALANLSTVQYPCACAIGLVITGSPTVNAESLPVARLHDLVLTKCGIGNIITASPTVFADD